MKKICPNCGKEFETGNVSKVYCSKLCRNRHDRPLVPFIDKVCVFCGKSFKTKMSFARCCSYTCADRLRRGWSSLDEYEKAQEARHARSKARNERATCGLTPEQRQDVIDAQNSARDTLWRRSQSWTPAQREFARKRYEDMHGLFAVICNKY